MKEQIIARRYAEAFIGYARNTVGITQAAQELKKLKIIMSVNPSFLRFLDNLEIIYRDKCSFIDEVLRDFSQETRVFLKFLLEKRRIKIIRDIIDYVRTNYNLGESIDGLLKTSYPLDLELVKIIKDKLERKFKRKLKLHIQLDGNLLGGVQVVVGNTIIDGSVRSRMDDLKERLMAVNVG